MGNKLAKDKNNNKSTLQLTIANKDRDVMTKLTALYIKILDTDSNELKNHVLQFIENEMISYDNDKQISEDNMKFISRLQSIAGTVSPNTVQNSKTLTKFERECAIFARIISYQNSIDFQKDLVMVIMDLCHGYNSLNSKPAYIARVLDTNSDQIDQSDSESKYIGYNCDYIGSNKLRKATTGWNAISLNTNPYPVDRLVLNEEVRQRLIISGLLTVSFRFRIEDIALGAHYGSLIQIMEGSSLNGNDLTKMNVVDNQWHVCVVRIERTKAPDKEEEDSKGYDFEVRYSVDNVELKSARGLIENVDNIELQVGGLNFGCHVHTPFNNVYKRVDGEVEDIRVYEWILDDMQCQTLMDNYSLK